jgi:hypothetical protein
VLNRSSLSTVSGNWGAVEVLRRRCCRLHITSVELLAEGQLSSLVGCFECRTSFVTCDGGHLPRQEAFAS